MQCWLGCCRRCVQQHHRGHRQNSRDQGNAHLEARPARPLGAWQVNRLAPAGINLYVKCPSSEPFSFAGSRSSVKMSLQKEQS